MVNNTEVLDLNDTRVPIYIPLAMIGVFAAAQLYLGTPLLIVALCALGITAPLLPLHMYGRDLYAIIGIIFSLRYTGVALIAKTFYGQPLDLYLYQPVHSFSLSALLMVSITLILLIARRLDHGGTLFPFPTDLPRLRRLSVICFAIGFPAQVIASANAATETGVSNAGPIVLIAGLFASLYQIGLIAEVIYGVAKSNGRTFFTPLLAVAVFIAFLMSVAMNGREFFLANIIAIIVTAFMYKAVRLQHVLGGLAIAYFFLTFLSPVTLYLRLQREGMPKAQFAALALTTLQRAATDPSFLQAIKNVELSARFADIHSEDDYDYYGDKNNALNRLSYISLLDGTTAFAQGHSPIGLPALKMALARTAPGFLGFDKRVTLYGMGDWLSWQIGLSNYGFISFLNFGLPMEGYATWGLLGFIIYPFAFILPLLIIFARVSSFKLRVPFSIYLFMLMQHPIVEGSSDYFLGAILKELPQLIVLGFFLYYGFFKERPGANATASPAGPRDALT